MMRQEQILVQNGQKKATVPRHTCDLNSRAGEFGADVRPTYVGTDFG